MSAKANGAVVTDLKRGDTRGVHFNRGRVAEPERGLAGCRREPDSCSSQAVGRRAGQAYG